MSEGRIADACLKLEESQRLDPGGGTILNLALCHEQEGKVARSWSEFNEAAAFARRDGRADREAAAGEHARTLEPRLSKLTIVVSDSARADGLRIECDGRELSSPSWSTAMPVDGGVHIVRATAPGKEPFAATLVIGKESDARTLEIPPLGVAPEAVASRKSSAATMAVFRASPDPEPVADSVPPRSSLRRTLAWTIGATGLVQLGVAGYFGWRAFDRHGQSNALCPGECINQRGIDLNNEAGRAADIATVLAATGLASVAAGVFFLVTAPRVATAEIKTKPSLRVAIYGRSSVIALEGGF